MLAQNTVLDKKTIVVGLTGSIAGYKTCHLVSTLSKSGASVHVIMTKSACRFVQPLTFQALSNNRVIQSLFEESADCSVEHIALARKADLLVIAPCTANFVAKLAHGLADDFLSTFALALRDNTPVILAPAMNSCMLGSKAYKANSRILQSRGVRFVDPGFGSLACRDVGLGKMAEPEEVFQLVLCIAGAISAKKDLQGKSFLVTAGATRERIDPARFLSNRSSGKTGLEIAKEILRRGGAVELILGSCDQKVAEAAEELQGDFLRLARVKSTADMFLACKEKWAGVGIAILAGAPCDYTVEFSPRKIKSAEMVLRLKKTVDIAAHLGQNKEGKKLVIFAAESEELLRNAEEKMQRKNADMCVANNISDDRLGFEVDENSVTIITGDSCFETGVKSKKELAGLILDAVCRLLLRKD